MIRLFDRNFFEKQNIISVLRSIFGLNSQLSIKACSFVGISPYTNLVAVPRFKLVTLESFVLSNFLIERPLRREYLSNLDQKVKKGTYIGIRLRQGLPAHGQRTHTNAKTARKIRIIK
jgi:small subunit ribosomal protein S13